MVAKRLVVAGALPLLEGLLLKPMAAPAVPPPPDPRHQQNASPLGQPTASPIIAPASAPGQSAAEALQEDHDVQLASREHAAAALRVLVVGGGGGEGLSVQVGGGGEGLSALNSLGMVGSDIMLLRQVCLLFVVTVCMQGRRQTVLMIRKNRL